MVKKSRRPQPPVLRRNGIVEYDERTFLHRQPGPIGRATYVTLRELFERIVQDRGLAGVERILTTLASVVDNEADAHGEVIRRAEEAWSTDARYSEALDTLARDEGAMSDANDALEDAITEMETIYDRNY
jgi:hypothetical protein